MPVVPETIAGKVTKAEFLEHAVAINDKMDTADADFVAQPAFVADGNAAGIVADSSAADAANSAALRTLVASSIAAAQAGTHSNHLVIELELGEYYWGGALVQTGGYNSLVPVPFNDSSVYPHITMEFRPKGSPLIGSSQYNLGGGNPRTELTFHLTLTGQTYDATHGWPSFIGGRAYKLGMVTPAIAERSWLHLVFRNVRWRQDPNGGLAAVDATYIDQRTFDDCGGDTPEAFTLSAGGAQLATLPTHPTQVFDLPPFNALDGNYWRGYNEVTGWYAGPSIGELMHNDGVLSALNCVVGLHIVDAFSHLADVGHVLVTRCPYTLAHVDPVTGKGSLVSPVVPRAPLAGRIDIEHAPASLTGVTWQAAVQDILDDSDVLDGELGYLIINSGDGMVDEMPDTGGAAANLTLRPLAPGGWRPIPALQNAWANFVSTGWSLPSYRKLPNGMVIFRGAIASGTMTAGTELFTMPPGYRPAGKTVRRAFFGPSLAGIAQLLVDVNAGSVGKVSLINAITDNTVLDLDDLTYLAEQ